MVGNVDDEHVGHSVVEIATNTSRSSRWLSHCAAVPFCFLFGIGLASYGQNPITNISVGTSPGAIGENIATNRIYVANYGSNSVTVIDGGTAGTSTIAVGAAPQAIAVNQVLNKIYVANFGSNNVAVIDGATGATSFIAVGNGPQAISVNPLTNKVYVANSGSANVTVIDGATMTTTNVEVGNKPVALATYSSSNKVYVANFASNSVTVIDGATNLTTTIGVGSSPQAIAVDPVNNRIYLANSGSNNVTAIDGTSNSTTTIATGNGPQAIAVDPVKNRIFVANGGSGSLTIIDGLTGTASTVSVGSNPVAVAVNPATNQLYVANASSGSITAIDGTTYAVTNTPVGTGPQAMALDPITNRIYVTNQDSGNVTVIDGATNVATTITAGDEPFSCAANPVTNKVYVANQKSSNVTVIDGATNATTTIGAGSTTHGIVVNPVTNKIYEIDNSANVTVIDGATNTTSTVDAGGSGSNAIAVNPVTNKIYVGNYQGKHLTVINGATGAENTIALGAPGPDGIAVNPVTNTIYVSNIDNNTLTVINGTTNAIVATVPVGTSPEGVALNPITNKIYVTNYNSTFVTVIDGATNLPTNVVVGAEYILAVTNPATNKIYITDQVGHVTAIDGATNSTSLIGDGSAAYVAVNPGTNKIYLADYGENSVAVVDGATGTTIAKVSAGLGPARMAVNPVTNRIYAANYGNVAPPVASNTVTAIAEAQVQAVPMGVVITPLTGNQASSPTPQFTFKTQSSFSPTTLATKNVFFQVDTSQGVWTKASGGGTSFAGTTLPLQPGFHILYAYTDVGQDATLDGGGSPLVSAIAAYGFLVTPQGAGAPSVVSQPVSQTVNAGQGVAFSVTATGTPQPTFQWYFNGIPLTDGGGVYGSLSSTLYLSGASANAGTYTCAAINSSGSASSDGANLTVVNTSTPSRLIDISARAFVGTGPNVLIAGYVIQGPSAIPVLIRSSGPALLSLNVTGVIPDPELQLYSGSSVIDSNAGWGGVSQIIAAANAVGAFAWPDPLSKDSALLINQDPGAFTAITAGKSGDTGVALAEVYDATPATTWNSSFSRLGDISARAFVGTGGNVLIAGFVIGGSTATTVLIRASGPALIPLNVAGALSDPQLQLYYGSTLIESNTGWGGSTSISAAASDVGAFAWSDTSSKDAALLVTLPPGAYTAIVSGASGDTGVSLAEVYAVP